MLITRSFGEIISDNPWQRAYWTACGLTGMNAALALAIWGSGVTSQAVNIFVAGLMAAGGIYCAVRMILSGALLGALPYFLFGSAIFYGAGTVFAVMNPAVMALLSFTDDVQRTLLTQVNAANALGIFLVVAAAGPLCAGMRPVPTGQPGVRSVVDSVEGALPTLMLVSTVLTCLQWAMFPGSSNPLLATLMQFLGSVPLFTILVGAALWDRQSGLFKLMLILLVVVLALYGVFALIKVQTLLPVLVLVLGWWLNGTMVRTAIVLSVVTLVVYFGAFAELVAIGRFHAAYDPDTNGLVERVRILIDSFQLFEDMRADDMRGNVELRFATVPFQAYFMALYDTGIPGDSLDKASTILIPRFFWPEKPIFNPGNEFDLAFRGSLTDNSLAIGFITEGYWNLGWLGVVIVSLAVGLQLGWFTRKWFLFAEHGGWHIGVFLLAPVVVYSAAWAEVNFVGGYIGGTARMFLIIMFIDMCARVVIMNRRSQIGA